MTGWLIERYINNELRYWGGRAADHFTPNDDEAIRFARNEDANLVLAWLCNGLGRVAEHMWCNTPEQPAADPLGQSMDEAAADNFELTVDDLDEGDDE